MFCLFSSLVRARCGRRNTPGRSTALRLFPPQTHLDSIPIPITHTLQECYNTGGWRLHAHSLKLVPIRNKNQAEGDVEMLRHKE